MEVSTTSLVIQFDLNNKCAVTLQRCYFEAHFDFDRYRFFAWTIDWEEQYTAKSFSVTMSKHCKVAD